MLENYVSAMEHWQGRVDSEEDYDSFRWHQWVRSLDLNADPEPYEGPQGFAFIGFCSEQGVQRNKGRVGAALAPDLIRQQMANLPCTFKQSVEIWDAGDIICQDISMENGQAQLAEAVRRILDLNLFPIVLGGVIVISIMTYIIILIVDLLYMAVDPRLRTAMLAPQKPKKVRKKEVSA